MVGFGMESLTNPGQQELYAINNTLVNEKANGSFFQAPVDAYFKGYGNILAGGGSVMSAWPTSIDTLGNLRSTSIAAVGFADAASYDFHIDEASPAHSHAYPAGVAPSGYPLVAWYEYVHPTGSVLRCQHATLDAGAFETCTTSIRSEEVGPLGIYPNPADDHVRISTPTNTAIMNVEIIDPAGHIVKRTQGAGATSVVIDLRDLPAGVFSARVSTASSRVLRASFVKVRP